MSDVGSSSFNVLSLATGAGGLDIGVKLAVPAARLVCAAEIEAYACRVLAARMAEGRLDDAPVWTDLRTFDGRPWRGVVDLVAAGYPCQPWSYAGQRRGTDDPRHLWPHVMRVVCECDPEYVFIENVAGHLSLGFEQVRADLRGLGFRVEAGLFAAVEAGAPHRRPRLYALAHNDSKGLHRLRSSGVHHGVGEARWRDADGRGRSWPPYCGEDATRFLHRHPEAEPSVDVPADGLGTVVDELRLTGNGVVPQQAALAFVTLDRELTTPTLGEVLS